MALHGEEGCGKSSTCAYLAHEASKHGLKFAHLHLAEHGRHRNPVSVIRRIVRNLKVARHVQEAMSSLDATTSSAPETTRSPGR